MPLDITGGAGAPPAAVLPAPIDVIQLMTSTRRGLGAGSLSASAQAAATTGISTGTGGQGVGFAMPPVIPWSQQFAVQFIQPLSPGAAAAAAAGAAAPSGAGAGAVGGEEAVEGGPEAPVPPSPAVGRPSSGRVAGAAEGMGGGGATAPSVTALPPSASAAVGEGPLAREKGVWLGAGNPLSRLLHRKRPTHAAGRGGLPLGAERVPVARGYDVDEHKLTLQALAEKFKVDIDMREPARSRGLSAEDAKARLRENGPNQLTPPKQLPPILQFLKQFGNLLMIM